ncbi:MAG: peptidylprolyl isomerase [Dehalococcoidia bacterium]|nr:peptidylprolyl isomerase [Dehalococcoidia bacterium]
MSVSERNRKKRKRAGTPAGQQGTRPALPVLGRTTRSARIFYIIGIVIIGGSLVGGLLIAQLGPGAPVDPSVAANVTAAPSASRTVTPTTTPGGTVKKYDAAPPMTIDPKKTYTAVMKTDKGDITIKLRPDLAPEHVNSFVFLAKDGYYDGVRFHRVIPGFVAQGGDPTGTGSGGPGYTVKAEFTDTPYVEGTVGMARTSDPNSAGSQFYISYGRLTNLDGAYTVFGEVTAGMDVAKKITPRDPSQNPSAAPGDKILSVTITES